MLSLTVARSVLFAGNKSLGVEEAPVGASADLIDNVGLEVDVKRAGNVLARRGLREESAQAIIVGRWRSLNKTTIGLSAGLMRRHGQKRVGTHAETVLRSVELPCVKLLALA